MTEPNDPINGGLFDPQIHAKGGISPERISEINNGLTKREYFAAMAMQGLLANSCEGCSDSEFTTNWVSNASTKFADSLITALNTNE